MVRDTSRAGTKEGTFSQKTVSKVAGLKWPPLGDAGMQPVLD